MSDILPVEVFSLAEMLADEMQARNWTSADVASRMSDKNSYGMRVLCFELMLCCPTEDKLIIPPDFIAELARVFGVSNEFFSNIHALWLKHPSLRNAWECPDCLLSSALGEPKDE